MITALVLLDRRIAGITKGVEAACALLISEVGRMLVRVLRPYAKKAGLCTPPHLNHQFYQRIAKALASYLRALIHV